MKLHINCPHMSGTKPSGCAGLFGGLVSPAVTPTLLLLPDALPAHSKPLMLAFCEGLKSLALHYSGEDKEVVISGDTEKLA